MFNRIATIIQTCAIVVVPFVMYKVMMRGTHNQIKEIVTTYLPMAKKAMGLVSEKGVDSRQLKTAEKMVMKDVMAQEMPEMEVIKGYLSGDTLAYLEENPQVLPALFAKYEPMLKKLAGRFMGDNGQKKVIYDV